MREELQEWLRFTQAQTHILNAHGSVVFQQALNEPDDSIVATAARKWLGTQAHKPVWVRLLNKPRGGGGCLMTLAGHSDAVDACAFSPDGSRIVSGSYDKSLKIWDAKTGRLLSTISGHPGAVHSCDFSTTGEFVVSGSGDKESGVVGVWDANTGTQVRQLEGHQGAVLHCRFSPDGKRMVSASLDRTLRVWDTNTWQSVLILTGHNDEVNACAFSPDGRHIVSGAGDWDTPGEIKIWDAATGAQLNHIDAHTKGVYTSTYSPNGLQIVSGSWDETLKVWDSETFKEMAVLRGHTDAVRGCDYSPDGRYLISAAYDNLLIVWDATSFARVGVLEGHKAFCNACAFSPDGKLLVSASHDQTLKIWAVAAFAAGLGQQARQRGIVHLLSYSSDARKLLVGAAVEKESGALELLDPNTLTTTQSFIGHGHVVFGGSWSPDGERIASASYDKTLKQWSVDGRELMTLQHPKYVSGCSYSPDGRRLVSSSLDKMIRLWDAASGAELATFVGHEKFSMEACVFSPDGRNLVSICGDDKTLRLWDAESATLRHKLEGHSEMVSDCAYSPDGRHILSASEDHTLKIWNARNGEEVGTLKGHSAWVHLCKFFPDGQTIVSGSSFDKTLRLWDTESLSELCVFFADVYSVSIKLNTPQLAIGDSGGSIHLLHAENFRIGTPITTAVHLYRFGKQSKWSRLLQRKPTDTISGHWDREPTADCRWCGRRFVPSRVILDAIHGIAKNAQLSSEDVPSVKLPDEAWDEKRLVSECRNCHQPVKFNPFIVDNRDRYQ